jgi:aspartyl-tRNA(Asn)/glutamyl-tRNA(Gln) amidotransferase subunit A
MAGKEIRNRGKTRVSSEAKPAESYVEKPKTLAELRAEIAAGATKATELAASYYDRIERKNPRLNIYLSLTKERALAQAAKVDAMAAEGDPLRRWRASRWASRMSW